MNEIFNKMLNNNDYEVVYWGEVLSRQLNVFLSLLKTLGYDRELAEAGICEFGRYLLVAADSGCVLPSLDYVEDIVAFIASFCRKAASSAA